LAVKEFLQVMPRLQIDNREVEVPLESNVLAAAKKLDIAIPTLCYMNGYDRFTSCMVCVVKEKVTDTLIPSCSAPAADGMVIETMSKEVIRARREALELLLREHVGDCEAPCSLACPANMDIPLMIRQIAAENIRGALVTIKKDIPFPAVLGRICPAPCESLCRRSSYDDPVAICLLKRYAADADLAGGSPWLPVPKSPTGKKIAIIGAGPAGMTAAYYLVQYGHSCVVFDDHHLPGGMLRYGIPAKKLPCGVLDSEIDILRSLGIVFQMHTKVGKAISIEELQQEFDAVVIAAGNGACKDAPIIGVELADYGIKVDSRSLQANIPGIFAGGGAVRSYRLAVRAVADGKTIAHSVQQFLNGMEVTGPRRRFNARIGRIRDDEIEAFIRADRSSRVVPLAEHASAGPASGFSLAEAVKESGRCVHCDCRKSASCSLRQYAEEYGVRETRSHMADRKNYKRVIQHPYVIYEPGKCIKCGRCVRITEKEGERLGLTFIGRGYDVRIGVSFNELISAGLEKSAVKCVLACPTGALSFKYDERAQSLVEDHEKKRF